MSEKAERPRLGRAPRPRMSDEEKARVMQEAAGAGGFDRPMASSAPAAPDPEPPPPAEPAPKPSRTLEPSPANLGWSVKFDVPDEAYNELLLAARRKRVTLKYLMLEILKEQGFTIDLTKASRDGRRDR